MTGPQQAPQLDPALILAKVERTGELGRSMVRAAMFEVLAEHYAAQVAELQDTGPATAGDASETPPDVPEAAPS